MCLNTKPIKGKKLKVADLIKGHTKIAKRGFTTYKYVKKYEGEWISDVMGFRYEKDMHYYQTGNKFQISRGYRNSLHIDAGLHSYTKKRPESYQNDMNIICIECKVPKGSEYFVGTNHDIVSDNLIVVGRTSKK